MTPKPAGKALAGHPVPDAIESHSPPASMVSVNMSRKLLAETIA